MIGKEALIILSKCCSALAFEEGKWKISERDNEALQTLKEIVQKYDKYKRAFEIFTKDKELTLHKSKEPILGTEEYKLSFVNWKFLTKEEYELLEELMKDDN